MKNTTCIATFIGGLVLALIVAYNTWTSRRNAPKRAVPSDPDSPVDISARQEPGFDGDVAALSGDGSGGDRQGDAHPGVLHGLDRETAIERAGELASAFRVEHAMGRLVTDYSSGMVKKIALAAALIHSPRLLVLDEPFESVDPVSAMTVAQILRDFAAAGGTVLLSSHSMELVQRICDHVVVIVDGKLIADGTVDDVRGDRSLQERFVDLAGPGAESIAELTWLHRFSD